MEIILNLSSHCIETASKKKFEHLIRQYFKKNITEKEKIIIEKQIAALKYFLEKADFSKLRNYCADCGASGSIKTKAVLIITQHFKNMHIRFNNAILYRFWKNKSGYNNIF
ncbi:MAG: hypothetical protein B6I26_05875 [Desulfobacteraceae bacterium 4572_130]|nr:MAG: hypothetical protein B6I26_05875 [Desulfobacteraceae bacterium 4572_130]